MVYVHGAWCIRGWGGPLRGNSVLIPHRVSRKAAPPSLPHLLGSAKPTLFWMRPTPGIALSDVPWENFSRIIYSRCMYDATIINIIVWMEIMTSIIISVGYDHHHSCLMRSSSLSSSMYDGIIIIRIQCDHHHSHTMWSSSWWRSSSSMYKVIFIICVRCDHHHHDFFLDLWSFLISLWNILDFSVKCFGFICEMFWISLWNVLDLSMIV